MRILLITDNHQPQGGAENYFFDLKNRLKNISGFHVFSLGFSSEEKQGEDFLVLKKLKSKVFKLFWQMTFHPIVFFKLRRYIKKIHPDVIHIHNVKQYTASLLPAIKDCPIVQTIHDYSVICPTAQNIHKNKQTCKTGMRKSCFWQHQVSDHKLTYLARVYAFFKFKKKLKKTVKKFIAPSPLLAEYLQNNHFENATYIMPFKKENQDYAFDKINPNHFLFAGNLGKHKGVDILINEFLLAYQKNPALTLTLAGVGTEEKNLQNKVSQLKLEKVIFFAGWLDNLENEYAKCAALIFPSIGFEAFGLVVTEAMSHARPVIGSDRSTSPWLIDNEKTGFIFNPLIKGELANRILKLAGDRKLIMEMGLNGLQKLNQLIDNEKVLKQIITIYEEIRRS